MGSTCSGLQVCLQRSGVQSSSASLIASPLASNFSFTTESFRGYIFLKAPSNRVLSSSAIAPTGERASETRTLCSALAAIVAQIRFGVYHVVVVRSVSLVSSPVG
jgi:hypothetical protein